MIFGKPFSGKALPMKDLEQDMYKVVVEGEVTVLNHRELKKRGAWIISFDMTDHTGSARIHCFMEAAQAKPILEGVQGPNAKKKKPGSWLSGPREGDGQPLRR